MDDKPEREPGPHLVDLHVGVRIRQRRKSLGISQEKLADSLGLTFQQVQKYERGANRVSASKLYEIGHALGAAPAYFYEGLADGSEERQAGVAEGPAAPFAHELMLSPEGLELASAFPRIRRARVRKRVLELVRALAEEEAREETPASSGDLAPQG